MTLRKQGGIPFRLFCWSDYTFARGDGKGEGKKGGTENEELSEKWKPRGNEIRRAGFNLSSGEKSSLLCPGKKDRGKRCMSSSGQGRVCGLRVGGGKKKNRPSGPRAGWERPAKVGMEL